MTLSHAASLLSGLIAVVCSVLFLSTGSLLWGAGLLAAALPTKLVRMSDRETWSVGEAMRGRRDDHTVSDALDDALRPPMPIPTSADDGAFFVPGVPRLNPRESLAPVAPRSAPASPTGTAPASTPLR